MKYKEMLDILWVSLTLLCSFPDVYSGFLILNSYYCLLDTAFCSFRDTGFLIPNSELLLLLDISFCSFRNTGNTVSDKNSKKMSYNKGYLVLISCTL